MRPMWKNRRFLDHLNIPAKLFHVLHSKNINFIRLQKSVEVRSAEITGSFQVSQVYNPAIERCDTY